MTFDPQITCHDCGSAPIWWYNKSNNLNTTCRKCSRKGGDRVVISVDIDLVLQYFGGDQEKTLAFLNQCEEKW
jgi:hypothetical protein